MSDSIEIVPIAEHHIEGFWRALDAVARERKYLCFVKAPPIASTVAFVEGNIRDQIPQFVALDADEVVGWCDITPYRFEGMKHNGELGMGIVPGYREQGLGSRLLELALAAATERGITRVCADVFASNMRARALYRRHGFIEEGIRKHVRILDGKSDDIVSMARFDSGLVFPK